VAKKSLLKIFEIDQPVDTTSIQMLSATSKKVVCVGGEDSVVVFEGKGLEISAGMIVSGTITGLVVQNLDGEKQFDISKTSVNAATMNAADMSDFFNQTVGRFLFADNKFIGSNDDDILTSSIGNDVLIGRGGDDQFDGGHGKDIMTGGGGEDRFVFQVDMGRDVIRDFDADGGDGFQDHIDATFPGAGAISASGKNTLIDFGDGDIFVLVGVKPNEIDASDFI
jgi:Ca2+-binding RTX toxin-like protein